MLKHLQSKQNWDDKSLANKGFTLIELLVVIVILGVLAAVVVFSVRGVTNDSKDSACATEKRTIATAIEAYYAEEGSYPADLDALKSVGLIRNDTEFVGSGYTISSTDGSLSNITCPA